MKKIFITQLILLFSLAFFIPKAAEAHFQATDGNITATLHIDPDDQPIAEQPTTLYFYFSAPSNKFDLKDCDCTLTISEPGRLPYSQSLLNNKITAPSVYEVAIPYTFPQRDVYTLTITGKPFVPNSFQPFTLTWNIRVDKQLRDTEQTKQTQKNTSSKITYAIVGLILVGLGVFYLLNKIDELSFYRKRKTKR